MYFYICMSETPDVLSVREALEQHLPPLEESADIEARSKEEVNGYQGRMVDIQERLGDLAIDIGKLGEDIAKTRDMHNGAVIEVEDAKSGIGQVATAGRPLKDAVTTLGNAYDTMKGNSGALDGMATFMETTKAQLVKLSESAEEQVGQLGNVGNSLEATNGMINGAATGVTNWIAAAASD